MSFFARTSWSGSRASSSGEGDSRKVHLMHVMPLAEAFQKQAKRMVIRIFVPGLEEPLLDELKDILDKHAGECPVLFRARNAPCLPGRHPIGRGQAASCRPTS